MADEERFSLKEFGASFKSFLDQVTAQGTTEEPQFARRLHEHLGQSPATLPIVAEQFAASDHANVQRAIDAYLGSERRTAEVVGIVGLHEYETVSIAHLIAASPWGSAAPGPVQHVNVGLDGGRILACLQLGLLLIRDGNDRLALLVSGPHHQVGFRRNVRLEAMAADRGRAERVLAEIRSSMRRLNVYRGHVISLCRALSFDGLQQFHDGTKQFAVVAARCGFLGGLNDLLKLAAGNLAGDLDELPHLAGELHKRTANINLTHVPYKASG